MQKNKTKQKKQMSLRGRIMIAFSVFAGVVLALLWIFQTFFLEDIYKFLKISELQKCADKLAVEIESVDFEDEERIELYADEAAKEYTVCISAYKIKKSPLGRFGELLSENHVNSFCFIHNIHSDDVVSRLYSNAEKKNGEYKERISLAAMFGGDPTSSADGENVILSRIIEKEEGDLFFVFNTEIMPLASTVVTLRLQLIFISAILLVLAAILSLILSNMISRPIRDMSNEASKLAMGDYNVNFEGGYSKETANLSETLNRAAYELSKLDKMQKDLIANVSHDLRTPLTMISGYAEAMRDLPGEATPENLQVVIDEATRLSSLVNDMVEISKYQGGAQTLKCDKFNITESIRSTIDRYSKLKEREGYKVNFDADREVYVMADEGRILQVLYNLINNAINYTGEDKTVSIRQTVESRDDGEYVLIEVIDTGAGISGEDLPLVWERYYKANDFHKRANMGSGLGLSIVKNILVLHGAEFGVRSSIGKGSCFWFILKTTE